MAVNKSLSVIANLEEITEREWLELRKSGIGASEVAGVMNLSPWQTPLSIYINKVEGTEVQEESLAMELGKELEPFMQRKFVQWLRDNEGITEDINFEARTLLESTDYPFIRCSPDGIFNHPVKGLAGAEYKTASEFKRDEFTADEIPDQYYLQCQTAMFVTGLNEWYLAYLIGNRKFEVLLIPRNEEVIKDIIETCSDFWNNYILTQTPPAPTGAYTDTQILKGVYPGGEPCVELPELENVYDELKKLEVAKKHIDTQIQEYKNTLMAEMGNHNEAVFGYKEDGKSKKATWRQAGDIEIKAHTRKGSRVFKTY